MSIVPIALRIYPFNSHSIVTLFLIVYVYNNALRYYCDELLDSIEVSNTEDASKKKIVVSYFVALSNHMKADPTSGT